MTRLSSRLLLTAGGVAVVGATGAPLLLEGAGATTLSPSAGTTYHVTNVADAGAGSLRQAILDANANPGDDTIVFDVSSGTILLTSAELTIVDGLTITGPGSASLTISGSDTFRIFRTTGTGDVTISGVSLVHGNAEGQDGTNGGGALSSNQIGNVTLSDVVMSSNTSGPSSNQFMSASVVFLANTGTMTIDQSVVSDNIDARALAPVYADSTHTTQLIVSSSTFRGNTGRTGAIGNSLGLQGGIDISDTTFENNTGDIAGAIFLWKAGSFSIRNSTMSGNVGTIATSTGALKLYAKPDNSKDLLIANSTFSGNTSAGVGAIRLVGRFASFEMDQTTITGNSAASQGSGLSLYGFVGHYLDAVVKGTVIAGNTGSTDLGHTNNAAFDTILSSYSAFGTFDQDLHATDAGGTISGVSDPMLDALADNGGPTKTRLPLAGSPLIGAGGSTVPTFPGNAFDQRGAGYPRVVDGSLDIGAVEYSAPAPPTTTTTTTSTTSTSTTSTTSTTAPASTTTSVDPAPADPALPTTGSDPTAPIAIGSGLLLAGGAAVFASRRGGRPFGRHAR